MAELSRDEGRRTHPYLDTANRLSIGVGRNLTDRGVSEAEIDLMLAHDIESAESDLDKNLTWWRGLDPVRQRAMLNLCFNMGWPTFSQFPRFFSAMYQQRWADAAVELSTSKWASEVGARATRIIGMITTGTVTA